MLSRHGQTTFGTVRYFAPAPSTAAEDVPPWGAATIGWDAPPHTTLPAPSGGLPWLSGPFPHPSGSIPPSGTPSTPPPSGNGPGPYTLPGFSLQEGTDGTLSFLPTPLSGERFWRVELRTSGGALVTEILRHWGGKATFRSGMAPDLEISTDMDEFENFVSVSSMEIWLRDWRGHLMGRFDLLEVERTYDGPERSFRLYAQGLLSRLSRNLVGEYSTPVDVTDGPGGRPVTVRRYSTARQILSDLLALQTRTPRITIGRVDPLIADTRRMLSVEGVSVMDAVLQLQSTMPSDRVGYLWVDDTMRLHWVLSVGVRRQTLSSALPAPALSGVRVRMRTDEVATRVYLYGATTDTQRRLSLLDAGLTVPYVERNVSTFGVRPMRKVDARIRFPETLLSRANRLLDDLSKPVYEVDIDAVDLSKADGGYPVPDIWCGSSFLLDDDAASPLAGNLVTANSVTYNLSNPLSLSVRMASRTRTMADLMESVLSQVDQTLDESVLFDSWEDSDAYAGHFSRMLASALSEASGEEETSATYPILEALREFLDDVYEVDGLTVPEYLRDLDGRMDGAESRLDGLEAGGAAPSPGTGIRPVSSEANADGTSAAFARADHEHRGVPVVTSGSPPESGECLKFEGGMLYMAVGSGTRTWLLLSHTLAEE